MTTARRELIRMIRDDDLHVSRSARKRMTRVAKKRERREGLVGAREGTHRVAT